MRYLILILLLPVIASARNQQVYYEPQTVELIGVIKILKFPGPPNYTSIKNGDADETGAYLVLNDPINVTTEPKLQNDDNMPENNVKILQLVVKNPKHWNQVKEDNKALIIGTLFHALTAHHHVRVLIDVKNIRVLSKQSITSNELNLTHEDQQFLQYQYLQE